MTLNALEYYLQIHISIIRPLNDRGTNSKNTKTYILMFLVIC